MKNQVTTHTQSMYDPKSETGARHWYYLDNKIYNKTTEAERATASEFIIGGRVKK